jgi:hypothetical protein
MGGGEEDMSLLFNLDLEVAPSFLLTSQWSESNSYSKGVWEM